MPLRSRRAGSTAPMTRTSAVSRHAGGKLILWHEWSDPYTRPLNTIDYYQRVARTLGAARRKAFARMFLFPGMGHCSGGDCPSQFNLLTGLTAMVEGATAPSVFVAHRPLPPALGGRGAKAEPAVPGAGPDRGGPPPKLLVQLLRGLEQPG